VTNFSHGGNKGNPKVCDGAGPKVFDGASPKVFDGASPKVFDGAGEEELLTTNWFKILPLRQWAADSNCLNLMNRVLIEPCIRNKRFGFEAVSSIENTFSYDLATLNHALRAGLPRRFGAPFIPVHPAISWMLMLRNQYLSAAPIGPSSHHACGVIN